MSLMHRLLSEPGSIVMLSFASAWVIIHQDDYRLFSDDAHIRCIRLFYRIMDILTFICLTWLYDGRIAAVLALVFDQYVIYSITSVTVCGFYSLFNCLLMIWKIICTLRNTPDVFTSCVICAAHSLFYLYLLYDSQIDIPSFIVIPASKI